MDRRGIDELGGDVSSRKYVVAFISASFNGSRGYQASRKLESSTCSFSPSLTSDELFESEKIAREDANVIERCRKLGYDNMSLVIADPWSVGYIGDRPEYQGKRLIQIYLYGRKFPDDNEYAHPFDFGVVVDILEGKVFDIERAAHT
ncbi:Copper methylamine oxidase [Orchesella cincta]|uniref:Amine oxidase n=1 Tax=Orchesella cincta TaxID=48709 RepID=A0A1D2M1B8_ORCCI|nr:Copper methylamine oxidase [Orchesella cincta]